MLGHKLDCAEECPSHAGRALADAATVDEPDPLLEAIKGSHPDNRIQEFAVEVPATYQVDRGLSAPVAARGALGRKSPQLSQLTAAIQGRLTVDAVRFSSLAHKFGREVN